MHFVLPLLLMLTAATAGAQNASSTIFTCVDANGKRYTSDRPIAECLSREQQILNRDGSVRQVVPPSLTADERAAAEARQRVEAERRAAQQEAVRRDRNLMQRYPTEAAHKRAREAALEPLRRSLKLSETRLELLARERKPLDSEAEFYAGKPLPGKLRQQIDGNEAAVAAQQSLMATQRAETDRINGLFDLELERLKKLWGGAAPGSLGPMAAPAAVVPAASGAAAASAAR
jgi:hypothetical protein